MKVAIYGLGYVGFTAACCLTKQKHEVVGVDVGVDKIKNVNEGHTPIKEPEVEEMLNNALKNNLIKACESINDLSSFDLAIICVGTPSAVDGSHNMGYIAEVARQVANACVKNTGTPLAVTFRSTFKPGTLSTLIEPIFHSCLGENFREKVQLVYNPEFLREGCAVYDYFNPPKIVVGTENGEKCPAMDVLHEELDAPVFYTKFIDAEFVKFVDNTWHAVKVAFANEIGRTCHKLGVSAKKTHEIFISDTKLNISPYYTRPGGAFGGSCLPKDVRALQYITQDLGLNAALINSLLVTNESHKNYQFEDIISQVQNGAKILMVGLAFKADTDDLRESPNVDIARKLLEQGYKLSIYDPVLSQADLRGQNLGYAYTYLPTVYNLLINKKEVEKGNWDLVISSNVTDKDLNLEPFKVIKTYEYE